MPYKRIGKCVYKKQGKKKGKKIGCSSTIPKAKKYLKALYANTDDILEEIKDYFNNSKDEDFMAFNDHPMSSVDHLLDSSKPAPWDDIENIEEVSIVETIKKCP
jgi:hypothetical protein